MSPFSNICLKAALVISAVSVAGCVGDNRIGMQPDNVKRVSTVQALTNATTVSTRLAVPQKSVPLTDEGIALSPTNFSGSQVVSNVPNGDKFGIEIDGPLEGARVKMFVDMGKIFRPMVVPGTDRPAPTDANGWPTSDAQTVFFDIRPFGAWLGPDQMDDPAKYQPDWSGTYQMSFNGQATLKPIFDPAVKITGQKYDRAKNVTTANLVVPQNGGILALAFTNTKRTATSASQSGITNIKVMRPGYKVDTPEIFTREFLAALKPFRVLRFMDVTSTNAQPGYYGDVGHHIAQWDDRRKPSDATQADIGDKRGVAWGYVIALANQTNKDLWINIPVSASDDYVKQLALLMKKTVKPNLNIYIEHSNEVWNFSFPQYIWNKLAAVEEVGKGASKLNNDGSTDQETWARRRHAQRLVEIGRTFRQVFGAQSSARIRPVYASWVINPKDYYVDVLSWVEKNYGAPKNHFYALASAAYYNAEKAGPTASVSQVLDAIHQNSRDNDKWKTQIQAVADKYGIKHAQYEVGPDVGGGKTENVGNRILANRDPRIKNIIVDDATRWFKNGGDLYMYFALASSYSRHGAWGLSEDVSKLDTPKWQAIYQLTSSKPTAKKVASPIR